MPFEKLSVSPDVPTQRSHETDGDLSPAVEAHARLLLYTKIETALHVEQLTGEPSKFGELGQMHPDSAHTTQS